MAYVYLLGNSGQDNIFKIGVTRGSVEKRIKQLQTGNSDEIYIVDFYKTDYPFFIERLLHNQFYPKQKRNEWFNLNVEDIINFKSHCSKIEEQAEALKDNPFSKNLLK